MSSRSRPPRAPKRASAAARPRFGENPRRDYQSSQHFAFELKFGPYSPNIDASPGLNGKTPFADLFPPDTGKTRPPGSLLTQVEFDYQFLHKWYGNFAIGNSVGYYRRTTHSFAYNADPATGSLNAPCSRPTTTNNLCVRSGDQTALNIVPLSIMARLPLRLPGAALQDPVRAVRQARPRLLRLVDRERRRLRLDRAVHAARRARQSQGGWGGTLGWVVNPGGAFLLDVLDPSAAREIDAELGINHTYLFCEFHYADISGFGAANKMNLSRHHAQRRHRLRILG